MRFFIFMAIFIDLTGQIYGKLTVVALHCSGYYTCVTWDCKCECGNMTVVRSNKLRNGHTQSCGCLKGRKYQNLVGNKYNMLTVISFHSKNCNNKIRWNCICDCGEKTIVMSSNLKNGAVKSCGCLIKTNPNIRKHGLSQTRLANILDNMKSRCYRPNNKSYKYYGGKGIKICDEWLNDNSIFFKWAISNGYNETLTIERKNIKLDYTPDNCKWATPLEQAQNKSTVLGKEKVLEIRNLIKQGELHKNIANQFNVNKSTIMKISTKRSYKNII